MTGGKFFESAPESFGDFEGTDASTENEFAPEVIEDAVGQACGDDTAQGVSERQGIAFVLEPGECSGE